MSSPTPVLLLKTRSFPTDSYHDLLSSSLAAALSVRFVPVLQHTFHEPGVERLRYLLLRRLVGAQSSCSYGGLVFTSQRAVEAFANVVEEERKDDPAWPHLQDVPIYSVGPATTAALSAVRQQPQLQIYGNHTGNGASLASYILTHYPTLPASASASSSACKPLLFLVGQQHRDVIPQTLAVDRIPVHEVVVYSSGLMPSFPADLAVALRETHQADLRWVVVFSPTGCHHLLDALGLLGDDGSAECATGRGGRTLIATIGPTTRRHLVDNFGFEPDVCAEAPSAEAVLKGIVEFPSTTGPQPQTT